MIKHLRRRFIRIAVISAAAVLLLLSLTVNIANYISVNSGLCDMLTAISDNQGKLPDPKDGEVPTGSAGENNSNADGENPPAQPPQDGSSGSSDGTSDSFSAAPDAPNAPGDPPQNASDGSSQNDSSQSTPAAPGGWDAPHERRFGKEALYSTRYFVLRYNEDGSGVSADLDRIAAVDEDDISKYLAIAEKHGEGFGNTKGYKFLVIDSGEGRMMAVFLDDWREMKSVATIAMISAAASLFCLALAYGAIVLFSKKAVDPVVKASQKQKQFITDASHELKTPVTVIATDLKLLEMDVGRKKWIDMALRQTEKLGELVNSLVALSRLDEDESPLRAAPFNAGEAVGECAASFEEYARSKGHKLNISVDENVMFCGDEYAVRQLASVFLDNAVKYASPDTPIDFSLEKTKRGIMLRTRNSYEGRLPDDPERLFDRFRRADESRGGEAGFGIGLSLARSIAEGHGGAVHARCIGDGQIEFTAELRNMPQARRAQAQAQA